MVSGRSWCSGWMGLSVPLCSATWRFGRRFTSPKSTSSKVLQSQMTTAKVSWYRECWQNSWEFPEFIVCMKSDTFRCSIAQARFASKCKWGFALSFYRQALGCSFMKIRWKDGVHSCCKGIQRAWLMKGQVFRWWCSQWGWLNLQGCWGSCHSWFRSVKRCGENWICHHCGCGYHGTVRWAGSCGGKYLMRRIQRWESWVWVGWYAGPLLGCWRRWQKWTRRPRVRSTSMKCTGWCVGRSALCWLVIIERMNDKDQWNEMLY